MYLIDWEWKLKTFCWELANLHLRLAKRPFQARTKQLLSDFELTPQHYFGATSDAGGDIRKMLESEFKLLQEWCLAHMLHAATKEACRINSDSCRPAHGRFDHSDEQDGVPR